MNNKGFTLVELLAVLVILITILTIAIPSITSSVEINKEYMLNKKIDIIETSMEVYVDLNKNKIKYTKFKEGNCSINIKKLTDSGILKDSDMLDSDGNEIKGYIYYDVVNKKNKYTNEKVGEDCNE